MSSRWASLAERFFEGKFTEKTKMQLIEWQTEAAGSESATPTKMSVSNFLAKQRRSRSKVQSSGASESGTSAPPIETMRNLRLSRQVDIPPEGCFFLMMIDIDHCICSFRVPRGSEGMATTKDSTTSTSSSMTTSTSYKKDVNSYCNKGSGLGF